MSAYVATTGSVGSGNPKKSVPKKPVPVPKRSLTKVWGAAELFTWVFELGSLNVVVGCWICVMWDHYRV